MGVETGTAALVTGIIGALASGAQTGLTVAQQQAQQRAARRAGRRLRTPVAQQRGREEEAFQLLRGQLSRSEAPLQRAAALEGVRDRFQQAMEQIESNLRRRGLEGQIGQQLARLQTAQATAESQALRNVALGEQARRQDVISQIAALTSRQPPSLSLGLQQAALAQRGAVSQNQLLANLIGTTVSSLSNLSRTGIQLGQLDLERQRLAQQGQVSTDIGQALGRLLATR